MANPSHRLTSALAALMLVGVWALAAGGPAALVARGGEPAFEKKAPGVRQATSGISTSRADATISQNAQVIEADHHDISPAVRSLPRPQDEGKTIYPVEFEGIQPPTTGEEITDPVVQEDFGPTSAAPSRQMPTPTQNFAGINNVQGYAPPDTNGDVGPNHYVQTVNVAMRIWDKSGAPVTSVVDVSTLFDGFGGLCETTNQGDPIVLYDSMADRWMISQFAFTGGGTSPPFYQCVAVSTTPNPAGTYYRYGFVSPNSRFNDYGKFGVWPDAYYMATNEFSAAGAFVGVGAWAMDRTRMLAGQSATMQYFHLGTNYGGFLPADLDGATVPPAGAPNPFVAFDDWSSTPRLKVMNFDVDWASPANSTFTAAPDLVTASFDSNLCGYGACIQQPGTTARLDTLSDRVMYRLAYRNFGTHQSLVVTHTVDTNAADRAGVRWYELRKTGANWAIQQQGTYAPDATNRFMPSGAMDGDGNIAVGYSVASSSVSPGLRFAGRLSTDPAGVLSQGESVLVNGSGSQTGAGGRWGDYASLSVDPADDCTFWFTSEYYTSTSGSNWATRIGSFTFPSCGSGGTMSSLSIGDASVTEGNSGSTNAVFPVTLSPAQAGETITVDYTTSPGTATAGTDYTTTSGTLSFAPNDTTESISVPVSGDTTEEANETFTVNLSNPSGDTTIADPQGLGTITNDDAPVGGCTVTGTEGNDMLYGTSGNDVICGLGGVDQLFGQAGNDVLDGGPGLDRVDFSSATGGVTLHIGNGTAVGAGNSGTDTLVSISDVVGSKFADTLTGDDAGNWFFASAGNDVLSGLGGNDRLRGQAGNDTITGGTGTDNCAQGGGTGVITGCES